MYDPQSIFIALLGGVLPALMWLWFWLKQDSLRPEPRGLLLFTFLAGMVCVILALPLEKYVFGKLTGLLLITAWAAIEEGLKYGATYIIALKTRFLDEPIDCVIYMITAALGFAALENSLFIIGVLERSGLAEGLATQNLRFIGASLLHVIASASIGIAMALSFYQGWFLKKTFLTLGIIAAIVLHTLFNFSIINGSGENIFTVFGFVWVVAIIFLLIFEKIKRMSVSYA